jgi:hypothetical protein
MLICTIFSCLSGNAVIKTGILGILFSVIKVKKRKNQRFAALLSFGQSPVVYKTIVFAPYENVLLETDFTLCIYLVTGGGRVEWRLPAT